MIATLSLNSNIISVVVCNSLNEDISVYYDNWDNYMFTNNKGKVMNCIMSKSRLNPRKSKNNFKVLKPNESTNYTYKIMPSLYKLEIGKTYTVSVHNSSLNYSKIGLGDQPILYFKTNSVQYTRTE